jgi:hypothetical protein
MAEWEWNNDNSRVTISAGIGDDAVFSIHVPVEDFHEQFRDGVSIFPDKMAGELIVEVVWLDERIATRPLTEILERWLDDHALNLKELTPEAASAMKVLVHVLKSQRQP